MRRPGSAREVRLAVQVGAQTVEAQIERPHVIDGASRVELGQDRSNWERVVRRSAHRATIVPRSSADLMRVDQLPLIRAQHQTADEIADWRGHDAEADARAPLSQAQTTNAA